jgi:hypothetical protein
MLKTIAAIGVSAALVLSPLVAIAQTDTAAPAAAPADSATPEKAPMKKKMHKKHMAKKKMEKPMDATPAAPAEAPKS